jgi:lipid-A-disaccharide synthase
MLGARLMAALDDLAGERFGYVGVGGPRMAERGLHGLFPMDELSLMGFAEVVPHIPGLLRRLGQCRRAIERLRPELVLTIDAPAFSLRLQRRLAGLAVRRVHYVAPQVWAWRPKRADRLARDLDHLLALLPFEPPFFQRHGLACSFVGHPIVEEMVPGNGPAFRLQHGIGADVPLLTVLPGSRRSEIEAHLPVLGSALERLEAEIPALQVVVPTLARIAPAVHAETTSWPVPVLVLEDRAARFDAYAASDAAIAASGTVALELALARLPFVTIYRTGRVTAWLVRRMIRVRYANLVNLILDRPAVPELLQEACTPDRIAEVTLGLLRDPSRRAGQIADLGEASARLLGPDPRPPSVHAAECVLGLLQTSPRGNA